MPVSKLIVERLSNTMLLMFSVLGLALIVGILAGWVMATFSGQWPDRVAAPAGDPVWRSRCGGGIYGRTERATWGPGARWA